MVAAQQPLVEDLGRAVERVVGVRSGAARRSGTRSASPYTEADDAATTLRTPRAAAASTTLKVPSTRTSSARRGSSAHWVMRMRRLVEDDIDAPPELAHERAVAHVAIDHDAPSRSPPPMRGSLDVRGRSCRARRSPPPRARPAGRRGWTRPHRRRRLPGLAPLRSHSASVCSYAPRSAHALDCFGLLLDGVLWQATSPRARSFRSALGSGRTRGEATFFELTMRCAVMPVLPPALVL